MLRFDEKDYSLALKAFKHSKAKNKEITVDEVKCMICHETFSVITKYPKENGNLLVYSKVHLNGILTAYDYYPYCYTCLKKIDHEHNYEKNAWTGGNETVYNVYTCIICKKRRYELNLIKLVNKIDNYIKYVQQYELYIRELLSLKMTPTYADPERTT